MSDQVFQGAGSVPVTIYGRTYHLRGDEDSAYLGDLASHVDGKMREVAEATGTADTLKLAILASLNIADEYMKASPDRAVRKRKDTQERLTRMLTLLDDALAEQT